MTVVWFVFAVIGVNHIWGLDPFPVIVRTSDTIYAFRGTTQEIRCDVNSRPDGVSTRWERTSYDCPEGQNICTTIIAKDRLPSDEQKYGLQFIASDTYILSIKNVDENDEGEYICQLPITRFIKVPDRIYMKVVDPPSIDPLKTSSDKFVEENDDVTLTCSAYGRPEPAIRWTRAGNGMMPGGGFFHIGKTLSIPRIKFEYSGPYICTARNEVGEVHRTINIDMNYAPVVTATSSEVKQKVGYPTRLICHVSAKPSATISWTIDGSEISGTTERYKVTTYDSAFKKVISKLSIFKVDRATYSADIRCIASSTKGQNEAIFKVTESAEVQPIYGSRATYSTYALSLLIIIPALYLL